MTTIQEATVLYVKSNPKVSKSKLAKELRLFIKILEVKNQDTSYYKGILKNLRQRYATKGAHKTDS